MYFFKSRMGVLQTAALGAVILLSACQSSGLPLQSSNVSRNIGPAQAPSERGTPLPSYSMVAKKPGWFTPHWAEEYLYIADQSNNQIDIFPLMKPNQPQAGTITAGIDGPYGLWYDRRHESLYVANQDNDTVTVYSHGSVMPSRTYSEDLSRPLYPIVDDNGVLYVGNANTGTVVEYLPGSTHAHLVVQTAGTEADGLALDKNENLFVAYRTSGGTGSIEEFAPGSTNGNVIGMTLDQPQGVIVTPNGTVVATETGGTNRIDVFPAGSSTESLEVPMPQGSVATELAIDCRDKFLYVSGLYNGAVYGVRYPLPGQTLFVQDQIASIIQGTTISDNQNF